MRRDETRCDQQTHVAQNLREPLWLLHSLPHGQHDARALKGKHGHPKEEGVGREDESRGAAARTVLARGGGRGGGGGGQVSGQTCRLRRHGEEGRRVLCASVRSRREVPSREDDDDDESKHDGDVGKEGGGGEGLERAQPHEGAGQRRREQRPHRLGHGCDACCELGGGWEEGEGGGGGEGEM